MQSLGDSNEPQLSHQDNNKDSASAAGCAKEKGLSSEIVGAKSASTQHLITEQESDPELVSLRQTALCEHEADKVPVCFYIKNGILMTSDHIS